MHLVNKADISFSGKDGKYTVIAKIGDKHKKVGSVLVKKAADGTCRVGLKAFGSVRSFSHADEVKQYVTEKLNTVSASSKKSVKIDYQESKPGQLSVIRQVDKSSPKLVGTIVAQANGKATLSVIGQDKDYVFASTEKAKEFVDKQFHIKKADNNGVRLVKVDKGRILEAFVGDQKVGELFKKASGNYMGITEQGSDVRDFANLDEAVAFFSDVKALARPQKRKTRAFSTNGISVVASTNGKVWKVIAKHLNKEITVGGIKRLQNGFAAKSFIGGEQATFASLEKATQFVTDEYRKAKEI